MILSRDPIKVTDHAVCRYLERQMGLNIELVREHILGICGTAAAFGASSVRAEGVKFIIADGSVVTVTADGPPNATAKRKLIERAA